MTPGIQDLLADLVAFDSRSHLSNGPIAEYCAVFLERLGWKVRRLPYTDDAGTLKINLVAVTPVAGAELRRPELALSGHLDVVPWDASWSAATTLTVEGDKLIGRGTCDMKGFVACCLAVAAETDWKTLERPLAIVLTADEEVGCIGAKRLAVDRALSPAHSIVGEPTSMKPVRAGKGYGLAELVVRGREAHSAYPELGHSAITDAARALIAIEMAAIRLRKETAPEFSPPYTTLNVGLIRGGTAKNVIPGECRATVEWRPVPGRDPRRGLELIRAELDALTGNFASIEVELKETRFDEGFETPPGASIVRFAEEATGAPAGTIAYGTEAPHFIAMGSETVVCGPGDMGVAHRTGEWVSVNELESCAAMLRAAVARFCA